MSITEQRITVALGNFDGMHLGHLAVLKKAREIASDDLPVCILLIEPHPCESISGEAPPELFCTSVKERILREQGELIRVPFELIRDMSPESFVADYLKDELCCAAVACGFNYRFGKNAEGDAELLGKLCEKNSLRFAAVPHVDFEGEPISSTRIRNALQSGEMQKAAAMLGRYFGYCLKVVSGDRRGRLIGFPTINQYFPNGFIVPKSGVYASQTLVAGKWHPSVTNIGMRPSFNGSDLRSETCIGGFSGNLYGRDIEVELLRYLREEKKFGSVDELREQINRDFCG